MLRNNEVAIHPHLNKGMLQQNYRLRDMIGNRQGAGNRPPLENDHVLLPN